MEILILATNDKSRANWSNNSGVASFPSPKEPYISDNQKVFDQVKSLLDQNQVVYAIGHYFKNDELQNEVLNLLVIKRSWKERNTFYFEFIRTRSTSVSSKDLTAIKNRPSYLIDTLNVDRLKSLNLSIDDWKPKVFIGGATESNDEVNKIASIVHRNSLVPKPWFDQFNVGDTTMHRLLSIAKEVDAAIFVFGEDDRVSYRDKNVVKARDNVIFEFGLFVAILGLDRVAVCINKNVTSPTDIEGIFKIFYSGSIDLDYTAQATIIDFAKRLKTNFLF
ncbi:TIR domain-containing protein [Paenibacillus silvae]|uniref:TIR domain-containing protein n=1 Tax=Paenibacillus silvae TaxID=1325358 RepID=UPI00200652B3|nr:TIR domain-containing protein [Paenibacillus silvae]MCK6075381.1 nucleotide-binding protein [Paenibacillus silvae]MCK6149768.1 nucleotide-binding protein [Paenibacillus silvae]MCK6268066.1 nucleotide-binding protein [Paenibacillus silvae]